MMRICKAIRNAQGSHSEIKTGQVILQGYTASSGTFREQWAASHFAFKFTNCAYRWRKS